MKKADSIYVTIGKIGAAYGVKGWLKIQSFTELSASILDYHPWYLSTANHQWQTIDVEDSKLHGNRMIVKLAGVNTPEEARLFTGRLIAVTRSQLPALKKDEYYWSDLQGLTVINQHGETLGKVIYLIETGANDVLVVKGNTEIAIPYLPGSVILSVDLTKQEIQVNWDVI